MLIQDDKPSLAALCGYMQAKLENSWAEGQTKDRKACHVQVVAVSQMTIAGRCSLHQRLETEPPRRATPKKVPKSVVEGVGRRVSGLPCESAAIVERCSTDFAGEHNSISPA